MNKFELYKYIKEKPIWEDGVPFEEQSKDTQQFWLNEAKKIKYGVKSGFYEMHPWLYWHINFWSMFVDVSANERILTQPSLRDNEFVIGEYLKRAEIEMKGLLFFGTRRYGKSAFISSFIGWNASTKYGGKNSVVGGSQPDLDNIAEYIDDGLDNVPEFLRFDKIGSDWSKGVVLGTRTVSNKKDVFSTISLFNVNQGKKRDTQKVAGQTPTSFVIDEIGKFAVKKVFNTAKYAFSTEYGWRAIPILLGTGGVVDLSKDAQELLANPSIHNLIEMDWDLLEKHVKKPTWKRKTWGIFVPAQMSIEPGLIKKESNLAEYLGVDSEELKKVEIKVTDWENATNILLKRREELKKDPDTLTDETMFLPLDPDDCFLKTGKNPFNTRAARRHKTKLLESGDIGKPVELFRVGGSIKWEFSNKDIPEFPFKGGNIDAPIIIFEDPPEDMDMNGTYVGGLDHYKHDKSNTDSLGVLIIFKREINLDEYSGRVVAIYASRPATMEKFNQNAELLMKAYGAEILQENADISFQQHLARKNEDEFWLANGEEFVKRYINPKASQNNKFGLPPTTKNKDYLLKLVIDYVNSEVILGTDNNGDKIIMTGVERINDIGLLDEIIEFEYGKNVDRITAFGHALAWARYLDDLNIIPKIKVKDNNTKKQKKIKKYNKRGFYSHNRGKLF